MGASDVIDRSKPIHSARDHGHVYGEAFMLMWYRCQSCRHTERIWNSRDGVTPFGCGCPSCGGVMQHMDWALDRYAPEHKLHRGQRFWRDGTPDEAEAIMRRRIDSTRDRYALEPAEKAELIERCRNGQEHEFQEGWPMLDIHDRAG